MTQLVNKDGSGDTLSNFSSLAYDAVGNRTALTASVPADTAYSGSTSYNYDTKNELTNEASTRNGGYTNIFAYDAAENPTTFRGTSGATFNSDNQITSTGSVYDGNGNPTTYKSTSLVFDVENRLTAVGSTLTAGYDAGNVRAWKSDSSGTTYYLYDGNSTVPVCEFNSSGTLTATNTSGADGLISRNTPSGGSAFYEFDPQGTAANRLNSSGSVTSSSTSDSFGVVSNSTTASDPFGYVAQAGYYTDQSTGLVLCTFRYYDPGTGRWLNRDPASYAGGINVYGFVDDDPGSRADSSGLWGAGVTGGITGEAGEVYGAGFNGSIGGGIFAGGSVEKSVYVYVAGQTQPAAALLITGTLVPAASFSPDLLNFSTVAFGVPTTQQITATIDRRMVQSIADVQLRSSDPDISGKLLSSTPFGTNRVRNVYSVNIGPAPYLGPINGTISLMEPSANGSMSMVGAPIPIQGSVVGGISASPQAVTFADAIVGHDTTQHILITGISESDISNIKIFSSSPFVDAQLNPVSNGGQAAAKVVRLDVTLSGKMAVGTLQTQVIITNTDGERLLLPIFAFTIAPQ